MRIIFFKVSIILLLSTFLIKLESFIIFKKAQKILVLSLYSYNLSKIISIIFFCLFFSLSFSKSSFDFSFIILFFFDSDSSTN